LAAQCIDELGVLAHKALMGAESHCSRLMLSAFDLDIMHVRTQHRLGDCGCVGAVILCYNISDNHVYGAPNSSPQVISTTGDDREITTVWSTSRMPDATSESWRSPMVFREQSMAAYQTAAWRRWTKRAT
jgi:hypothetical protein